MMSFIYFSEAYYISFVNYILSNLEIMHPMIESMRYFHEFRYSFIDF